MKLDRKNLMERAGLAEVDNYSDDNFSKQTSNPYKDYLDSGDSDQQDADAVSRSLGDVNYETYVKIIDGFIELGSHLVPFDRDTAIEEPALVQDFIYDFKREQLSILQDIIDDIHG